MPSNTVKCYLGFDALLLGGVGGWSLIKKKPGRSIRETMKALAKMKNSKFSFARCLCSSSLSSLYIKLWIKILLMKIPAGPLIMLTPVAKPLSCWPNQLFVSFVTGFLRKADAQRLIICPKKTGQKLSWYTVTRILSVEPNNIKREPHIIQTLSPHLSITSELIIMQGMYNKRSAYFAVYRIVMVTCGWYAFKIMGLLVLRLAEITPVEAEARK